MIWLSASGGGSALLTPLISEGFGTSRGQGLWPKLWTPAQVVTRTVKTKTSFGSIYCLCNLHLGTLQVTDWFWYELGRACYQCGIRSWKDFDPKLMGNKENSVDFQSLVSAFSVWVFVEFDKSVIFQNKFLFLMNGLCRTSYFPLTTSHNW